MHKFDICTHKILKNLSNCLTGPPSSNEHCSLLILDQLWSSVVQGSFHALVLRLSDHRGKDLSFRMPPDCL